MFEFVLFCDWTKVRKIEPKIPLHTYRRHTVTLYKILFVKLLVESLNIRESDHHAAATKFPA